MFRQIEWGTDRQHRIHPEIRAGGAELSGRDVLRYGAGGRHRHLLAYTVNRSRIPCKGALSVLATLPMLIPSISHGLGLINLFGRTVSSPGRWGWRVR